MKNYGIEGCSRKNIDRLRKGTESKISFRSHKKVPVDSIPTAEGDSKDVE